MLPTPTVQWYFCPALEAPMHPLSGKAVRELTQRWLTCSSLSLFISYFRSTQFTTQVYFRSLTYINFGEISKRQPLVLGDNLKDFPSAVNIVLLHLY